MEKYYQVMAVTRSNICKNGMESLSRGGAIIYYASVFLYFWVFSTPVVSLVFGSYLYICINWLHIHFDEAFSSLRIANYKAFTRFHIDSNGDLEVFTLAVDKVRKSLTFNAINFFSLILALVSVLSSPQNKQGLGVPYSPAYQHCNVIFYLMKFVKGSTCGLCVGAKV
jgi:hypothetical protein